MGSACLSRSGMLPSLLLVVAGGRGRTGSSNIRRAKQQRHEENLSSTADLYLKCWDKALWILGRDLGMHSLLEFRGE